MTRSYEKRDWRAIATYTGGKEVGVSLPLALIILALGVVLATPLLLAVSTNLQASQTVDQHLEEQYSSDAGVEYAIWKISNDPDFRSQLESSSPVTITLPTSVNGSMPTVTVALVNSGGGEYAIWANSPTCHWAIEWSGSGTTVNGNIHSNEGIKVSGSGHTGNGLVTYVDEFRQTGSGHNFPDTQKLDDPQPMPINFDISDYSDPSVPGTPAYAADQEGKYYYKDGDWTFSGAGYEIPEGLYYATGKIKISGSGVSGHVTMVAEDIIDISGSGHSYTPYCGNLLFFSNKEFTGSKQCNRAVISISGSGNTALGGIVYAPHGKIKVTGSGNMGGSFIGDSFDLSGSGMVIQVPEGAFGHVPAGFVAYDIRSTVNETTTTARVLYSEDETRVVSWLVE